MQGIPQNCWRIMFLLISVISICPADAQTRDSLLSIYNNQTIRTAGNQFMEGPRQLNFRDLKSEMTSAYTMPLFKKARADRRVTWLFSATGIAALVTSIIVRKNNENAANGLSIAAVGLNLFAIRFRNRSSEKIDEAIWIRNKEILFR